VSKADNRITIAAFKRAVKLGEKADHAAAQLKRYAEFLVKHHGAAGLGMLPEGVTVDDQGVAHVAGFKSWSSGVMMLRMLANAVEGMGWDGETLASFISMLRDEIGHEPSAAVRNIILRIQANKLLTPGTIAALLLAEAMRIRKEQEADDDGHQFTV
jgi:hypothetical protein